MSSDVFVAIEWIEAQGVRHSYRPKVERSASAVAPTKCGRAKAQAELPCASCSTANALRRAEGERAMMRSSIPPTVTAKAPGRGVGNLLSHGVSGEKNDILRALLLDALRRSLVQVEGCRSRGNLFATWTDRRVKDRLDLSIRSHQEIGVASCF